MTMSSGKRRLFGLLGLVLCLGLSACASEDEAGGDSTDTQGSVEGETTTEPEIYSVIDPALQPFREDFEAGYGQMRLIAIVAPTCGSCLQNARAIIEEVLPAVPEGAVDTYIIWSSVLVTDVEPRARRRAEEMASPNVKQYWDETGRVARAFGRVLQIQGKAYDCYFLYPPDATWDLEKTMASEPEDYNALLEGWFPSPPPVRLTKNRGITLPGFTPEVLLEKIVEMMAS